MKVASPGIHYLIAELFIYFFLLQLSLIDKEEIEGENNEASLETVLQARFVC